MKWTDKDAERARKEGWVYQNGYVRQHFGPSPFYGPMMVVKHLREKGRKSKWHRDVYLSLPWTEADDMLSKRDGWRFAAYGTLPRISAINFSTDEEAQQYVSEAAAHDPLCVKALARLAKRRLLEGVQI